jgi:hypothetical protein
MRAAKYPLAVVFALLLMALPICAQICDLNCSFYGCSLAAPGSASQSAGEEPACHKHKSHGQAPDHKRSTGCAGHADVMALRASVTTSASPPPTVVGALVPGPLASFRSSPERSVAPELHKPDRSPPTRAVLRL